jgi:hypothetical protein
LNRVTVNFDIIPRQALNAADFKALGRSLRRWLRLHAKQQGSVRWYDSDSLDDLLKGRPPRPLTDEREASINENITSGFAPAGATVAVLESVEEATPRPVCLSLVYNRPIESRQILTSVRKALSNDLVADVLIDGRSWDDPAQKP